MSYLRAVLDDLFHPSAGSRADDIPAHELIPPRGGYITWAGVPVNERVALQQLTVWSCASLMSDSIAMLPVGAFIPDGPARVPVTPDPPLLVEPHAEIDWVDWIGRLGYSAIVRGNAYGWIVARDSRGFATQVLPLHPDEVWPKRDKASGRVIYTVLGEKTPVPAFDMMHVRGMTPPGSNQLVGLNPIEYARQAIGLAAGVTEFGNRFFGDGGHPSSVLESDEDMDEDDAKRYQEMWLEAHGQRHRKPAVLAGGLKWKAISLTPNESQFLETRKFSRSEIAGFFRVPPHMIGDVERSTSWGTGIEEQSLGFVTFTLGIWLVRFERALGALLPKGQYVRFNVGGLLRGRLLDQYRAFLMGRQGGWLSIDDIRALLEMGPLPDGRGGDYLQPLNYAPIPPGGGSPDIEGPSVFTQPDDEGKRIAAMLDLMERRLAQAGNGHGR